MDLSKTLIGDQGSEVRCMASMVERSLGGKKMSSMSIELNIINQLKILPKECCFFLSVLLNRKKKEIIN